MGGCGRPASRGSLHPPPWQRIDIEPAGRRSPLPRHSPRGGVFRDRQARSHRFFDALKRREGLRKRKGQTCGRAAGVIRVLLTRRIFGFFQNRQPRLFSRALSGKVRRLDAAHRRLAGSRARGLIGAFQLFWRSRLLLEGLHPVRPRAHHARHPPRMASSRGHDPPTAPPVVTPTKPPAPTPHSWRNRHLLRLRHAHSRPGSTLATMNSGGNARDPPSRFSSS